MNPQNLPQRLARKFLDETFELTTWENLKPWYEKLQNQPIPHVAALRQWFVNRSELESYLSENFAWRYIRMTCDTASSQYQTEFNDFVENIQPHLAYFGNLLDQKALECPFLNQLEEKGFQVAIRGMKKAAEIFREINVPLLTQIQTEQAKYGAIVGAMSVLYRWSRNDPAPGLRLSAIYRPSGAPRCLVHHSKTPPTRPTPARRVAQ